MLASAQPVTAFALGADITFLGAAMSWDTSLLPIVVLVGADSLGTHAGLARSVPGFDRGLLGIGGLFPDPDVSRRGVPTSIWTVRGTPSAFVFR